MLEIASIVPITTRKYLLEQLIISKSVTVILDIFEVIIRFISKILIFMNI